MPLDFILRIRSRKAVSPSWLAGLAGIMSFGLFLSGCSSPDQHPTAGPSASAPVTVAVTQQDLTSVVVLDGAVEDYPTITLLAPQKGSVNLDVKQGQSVKKGQQLGTVGAAVVSAPSDGVVSSIAVPSGVTEVPINAPLLNLRYAGFGIRVVVDAAHAYRASGRPTAALATLTNGAAGFACVLASAAADGTQEASAGASNENAAPASRTSGASYECLIPTETDAFAGESAQVGIQYETVKDALVLPVASVTGSAESGMVRQVCVGKDPQVVKVALGISDGAMVQIVSGLALDDHVTTNPPELGDS